MQYPVRGRNQENIQIVMHKIICPSCNKENIFNNRNEASSECTFCWKSFPENVSISELPDENREIVGLTLVYQIKQHRLEVSTLHKTILGRENLGASLFSTIFFNGKPVISRKHCSIEFIDGNFYLLDEGSLNGTYYGVNKISCKNAPQIIENKSILYIGEEPFFAQINFKTPEINEITAKAINEELKKIKGYRCKACGSEFNEYLLTCSTCERYNTLIEL